MLRNTQFDLFGLNALGLPILLYSHTIGQEMSVETLFEKSGTHR